MVKGPNVHCVAVTHFHILQGQVNFHLALWISVCSRFVSVFGLEQRGWCFQNTVEQKVLNAEFVVCCMVGNVELIVD